MIKKEFKKWYPLLLGMLFLLFITHYSLLRNPIITADVLLNHSYYNGYSWELSLGRFGLFFMGILKSYLSIPMMELVLSFFLIIGSTYLLIHLFEMKRKIDWIFTILVMTVCPTISATLLFHYCSVEYFLAFFLGILSYYLFLHTNKTLYKYILPVILIVISLSMYQAYISLIVTVFILYTIRKLIENQFSIKDFVSYFILILLGLILYYIIMKIVLALFHIDMASYSNAKGIGLSTLLRFPTKIKDAYLLFYQMFFQDSIMKNSYFKNTLFYFLLFVLSFITIFHHSIHNKITLKNSFLLVGMILLLPVFLNCIIFMIDEAKLQLLMSASYVVIPIFILSLSPNKWLRVIIYVGLGFLLRNYFIETQASYMTLEETYQTYYHALGQNIQPNQKYLILGEIDMKNNEMFQSISNMNYGYITDDGIFWEEYHLRKLGVERFCQEYLGISITFGEEGIYQELTNSPREEFQYEYKDYTIIDLNHYYQ